MRAADTNVEDVTVDANSPLKISNMKTFQWLGVICLHQVIKLSRHIANLFVYSEVQQKTKNQVTLNNYGVCVCLYTHV